MSEIAIRADGLSKLYRIGRRERYYTLRDAIAHSFTVPFWRFRNGRQPAANESPAPPVFNPHSAIRNSPSIWALKDVSFEIRHGDVVGIIGRNGAGKSTLLKILSQITEPTEGEARVHGRVGSLLEVGTGFHPELTGRENIYLNGAILGMKKKEIERKFDEIVAFAEVEKFLDTPVKHYSSGMYMRLAFSVAAHLEPEILLVDEVLAVGDAAFQKKCLGKMHDVSVGGRTVLFVSHNMRAIRALCPKSIFLHEGRLQFDGTSETAITQYLRYLDPYRQNTGSVEVELSDHSHKAERMRFLRVSFRTAEGEPCERIAYRQPFVARVEADVREPIKDCRLGMGIDTADGFRITTIYNTDCGDGLQHFSVGPAVWEILIRDNILTPGSYQLGVNAMTAVGDPTVSGEGVEHIPPIIPFEVSDFEVGSPMHSKYAEGPVVIAGRWSRIR